MPKLRRTRLSGSGTVAENVPTMVGVISDVKLRFPRVVGTKRPTG
jgi:hypothetical protein